MSTLYLHLFIGGIDHPMKTRIPTLSILFALLAGVLCATAATIQYAYDDAGRLIGADYGGGATIAYVYDANGNLLQRTTTAGGATTYTLIYRAGTGGWIDGVATQQVAEGSSGSPVEARGDDGSAVFRRWSDGSAANPRTDANVQADLTVTASFLSTGGADLDWYAARGISPAGGETWADVDARTVPGKDTTCRQENIADTDPADPSDVFKVTAADAPLSGNAIRFLSSTGRLYTLQGAYTVPDHLWTNLPGRGPRPGVGGPDSMPPLPDSPAQLYRLKVGLP
ncbi:MAG: hypothetical protein EOM72_03685 [Opitutae bacterium]|nr:hypothetical protein [Opitutae bacterium]